MTVTYDKVKQYSVTISIRERNKEKKGSGIIVNPGTTSQYCYVLTAKHLFRDNGHIIELSIRNISIDYFFDKNDFLRKDAISLKPAHFIKIDEDDLMILILDKRDVKNACLKDISSMSILEDDFEEGLVVGYPTTQNDYRSECTSYLCDYDKTGERNSTYELRLKKLFGCTSKLESIQELLGGGVFTQGQNGQLYLVGIQIGIGESNNFICIDLRSIIEKINQSLKKHFLKLLPIELASLDSSPCSDLKGVDLNSLRFEGTKELINPLQIQELKKLSSTEQFERIKDYHSEETKLLRREIQEVENKLKILADIYLYRGIICHENKDNKRATKNFNQAIKYHPHYKIFFLQAKELQGKEHIETLIKGSSSNNEIQQIIRLLEQRIHEEKQSVKELEGNYLTLLKLYTRYQQDENFTHSALAEKKEELLYKLGCLYSKQKNYSKSENAFKSIVPSDHSPKKLIQKYTQLIKVLYAQGKYAEAKSYCLKTLELLKPVQHFIPSVVRIYSDLMIIGHQLKEENAEIDNYRSAKKYLDYLDKNSKVYQRLSTQIEKRWLIIKSSTVDDRISSDHELKDNIKFLKENSQGLVTQHRSVEQKMERVEQQLVDIRNLIEKQPYHVMAWVIHLFQRFYYGSKH